MRKLAFCLLAALTASTLVAGAMPGTASAAASRPLPKGTKALTANPIYRAGKLPVTSCPEVGAQPTDYTNSQALLMFEKDCLDSTWKRFFGKVGFSFRAPSLELINKYEKTNACGRVDGFWGGAYCDKKQGIVVMIDGWMLEYADSSFLPYVLAHEYGHHVQKRAGILTAYDAAVRKMSRKKAIEFNKRMEEQADCLSGAFLKSIWASLGYPGTSALDQMLTYITEDMGDPSHGGGKHRAYWVNRGYRAGAPSACNTFTAPYSIIK
ncbi:neutral zinc metallopeptidase [Streptosporangiaceae bacterium NEAU-GS5]|nr:neutral zinc metallopeptidase [Streptosporangiaceae bacterium NEAU-GS5]